MKEEAWVSTMQLLMCVMKNEFLTSHVTVQHAFVVVLTIP